MSEVQVWIFYAEPGIHVETWDTCLQVRDTFRDLDTCLQVRETRRDLGHLSAGQGHA